MRLKTFAFRQPVDAHLAKPQFTSARLAAWILSGFACLSILPSAHFPRAKAQDTAAAGVANQPPESDADVLAPYREAATKRWEKEIQKYETLDAKTTDPADGILLIGSSSIRRWDTAADDLAPFRVIPRGYGGARYSDLAVYAERLITPHDFRAIVAFVGNDISGKETDATPEEVEQLVRHVVAVAREHRPGAPVLLVEVTPTRSRYDAWPKIRELNAMLREVCFTEPNVHFVATAETFLTHDNEPRENLFVDDQLHLNEEGYVIWGKIIRDRLTEVLREQAHD